GPHPDGDVAQEHGFGQRAGVAEVGPGDLGLILADRADPFGLVVGVHAFGLLLELLGGGGGLTSLKLLDRQNFLFGSIVARREDRTLFADEERAARGGLFAVEEVSGGEVAFAVTCSLVPGQLDGRQVPSRRELVSDGRPSRTGLGI